MINQAEEEIPEIYVAPRRRKPTPPLPYVKSAKFYTDYISGLLKAVDFNIDDIDLELLKNASREAQLKFLRRPSDTTIASSNALMNEFYMLRALADFVGIRKLQLKGARENVD